MLSHVQIAKTRRRPAHPAGTGVPRPGEAGGGGVLSGLLRAGGAAFFFCRCWAAAGTPTAPWASSCGTPSSPADRGRIYSADGVLLAANSSCWTLRASPGRCRKTAFPLRPRAWRDFGAGRREASGNSATAAPTTASCATGWTVGHGRRRAGLLRGKRHHRHPHRSGLEALVPAGRVSGLGAGASPMWTTRASRASN